MKHRPRKKLLKFRVKPGQAIVVDRKCDVSVQVHKNVLIRIDKRHRQAH
jgi:hypothetical protein